MSQPQTKLALSYVQRKAIDQMLQPVVKANDDGTSTYAEGWNDAIVAKKMDFICSVNSVATLRKQLFGNLYRAPETGKKRTREILAEQAAEIASLKDRVAALEMAMLIDKTLN